MEAAEEGTVQLRSLFFKLVRVRPKIRSSHCTAEPLVSEQLEARQLLAADSAGFRSDLLANSDAVFIDAAAVCPAPIILSQSMFSSLCYPCFP